MQSEKEGWFRYWDDDHSASLEKEELLRALVHTFKLGKDYERLQTIRSTLDAIWPMFDTDGSGSIEMEEFLGADGLANTIVATIDFV